MGPPIAAPMAKNGNNYQVYKLSIISTFRGRANVQRKLFRYGSAYVANLYTPSRGLSCRVQLKPFTEYLLFGKIMGGNLYTSFCNWHQKWMEVTSEQRAGVERQYSPGCECRMGFCFTPSCQDLLPGCSGYDKHFLCRAKYHRCEKYRDDRDGAEKCRWQGSGLFQQCTSGFGRFP